LALLAHVPLAWHSEPSISILILTKYHSQVKGYDMTVFFNRTNSQASRNEKPEGVFEKADLIQVNHDHDGVLNSAVPSGTLFGPSGVAQ
jgi:hypothetical protein